MSTFRLKLLPAADGDCMILSWGAAGTLSHMAIDGGRLGVYPHFKQSLAQIAAAGEELELLVLTHIDADHIEGALAFLRDRQKPIVPKEVWYNGHRQMTGNARRSMKQGDEYSAALERLRWPWNRRFVGGIASVEAAMGPIDVAGLKITMLSPDTAHLKALGQRWTEWRAEQEAKAAASVREGMRAAPRRERSPMPVPLVVEDLVADGETDKTLPNGTSIAFVAEWQGRRILFGGDAHPDLLASSLATVAEAENGRYRVDLLKASHHGSARNTSRQLIQRLDCRMIALSSNGNLHDHPDPQSIARFIHFGPAGPKSLLFNYETDRTRPWGSPETMRRYDYDARYPTDTPGMLEIDLMA